MKMMPGGPKLCSHHRLAGPSLALREGDHTIGGGLLARRHGTYVKPLYGFIFHRDLEQEPPKPAVQPQRYNPEPFSTVQTTSV